MSQISISLTGIYTPINDCEGVHLGPVDSKVVERLARRRFDQVPVIGENGRVHGIIGIDELRRLCERGERLTIENMAIERTTIREELSFAQLLEAFQKRKAILVTSIGTDTTTRGLLTISDLNKPRLRTHIYPLLVEIESKLAEIISHHYDDPFEWLPHLAENEQVQVVGNWQLAQKRSTDLNPVHYCTITALIRVVSAESVLWKLLGYASRKDGEKELSTLPALRNIVMHPVRMLIRDVNDLNRSTLFLQNVTDTLNRLSRLPDDD